MQVCGWKSQERAKQLGCCSFERKPCTLTGVADENHFELQTAQEHDRQQRHRRISKLARARISSRAVSSAAPRSPLPSTRCHSASVLRTTISSGLGSWCVDIILARCDCG